ncbi:Clavaminate synthase-like protein [Clathrospora elynae]|uniref:Clavaminate synthase-like protein n=1 Tax=Clathrospora elynae TaxID=706981 RepID=A0A6A5T2C6_9PLEO|nr:Clavaminate synthase-like protein [Clathrospora elynae]
MARHLPRRLALKYQSERRYPPSSPKKPYREVRVLEYDDVKNMSIAGFDANTPAVFRRCFADIPAVEKWFKRNGTYRYPKELKTAYLDQFGDAVVSLELTRTCIDAPPTSSFERFEAPLSLLLAHMSGKETPETRLYLAQHSLADLPETLQAHLPTPTALLSQLGGRGDIYASSLWMGRPPTQTPLHRDPNPNLFVQLAGKKMVRLMRPQLGREVYERVRMQIRGAGADANIRGEEMMHGDEMEALERVVWDEDKIGTGGYKGVETELGSGDALYIPLGWWHAVRGVGKGANASVNWWFR